MMLRRETRLALVGSVLEEDEKISGWSPPPTTSVPDTEDCVYFIPTLTQPALLYCPSHVIQSVSHKNWSHINFSYIEIFKDLKISLLLYQHVFHFRLRHMI